MRISGAIAGLLGGISLSACLSFENIKPDHLVSRPVKDRQILIDGNASEWTEYGSYHALRSTEGESDAATFRLTHDPSTNTLYVLLIARDAPQRVDLFLDVSGDATLDRPVQLIFEDELAAAQAQHLAAATAVKSASETETVYEWTIDFGALGSDAVTSQPTNIGFDIEIRRQDGELLQWGDGEEKWFNKRRLSRLSLVPADTAFGRVEGETRWADKTHLSHPQRVLIEHVGNDGYRHLVKVGDETGAFETTVPVGVYLVRAIDSRTVASLSEPVRVSVKANKTVSIGAVITKRSTLANLDAVITEVIDQENLKAIGVAYVEDGRVAYAKAFGKQANGDPAGDATIFRMASVSKPVAAMAVFSLVANGLWSLDEPLANYWTDPDIADDPRHRIITSRMVLSHTSGLPNSRGDEPLAFLHNPGVQQSYSGEGFTYLRRAVEVKLKRPFQEIAEEYVFDPAGMRSSSYIWPEGGEDYYAGKFHGEFIFNRPAGDEADVKGGLLTTVPDLEKFLLWMIDGAGLSDNLWSEIAATNNPSLLLNPEDDPRRYGLGWVIYENAAVAMTHGGSERGARAYIALLPEERSGLVVVANGTGGLPAVRTIFEATLKKNHSLAAIETEFARWESFDW